MMIKYPAVAQGKQGADSEHPVNWMKDSYLKRHTCSVTNDSSYWSNETSHCWDEDVTPLFLPSTSKNGNVIWLVLTVTFSPAEFILHVLNTIAFHSITRNRRPFHNIDTLRSHENQIRPKKMVLMAPQTITLPPPNLSHLGTHLSAMRLFLCA